jgi:hypothetical protein
MSMSSDSVAMSVGLQVVVSLRYKKHISVLGFSIISIDKPPVTNETVTQKMIKDRKLVSGGKVIDWTDHGQTAVVENNQGIKAAFNCGELSKKKH